MTMLTEMANSLNRQIEKTMDSVCVGITSKSLFKQLNAVELTILQNTIESLDQALQLNAELCKTIDEMNGKLDVLMADHKLGDK